MQTPMKTMTVLATALACVLTAGIAAAQDAPKMKMTTPIPAEITTPDTVETRIGTLKFNDGFPTDETVQKVYDNLAFQRGVSVFLSATGGSSTEGLRQGLASIGVDNNQTVALFEDLMDSKSLFLTPNTESIYNIMWVDVKDGPVVLETPPDVLGIIDDHWFHYVADFGRVGPDKGQGGKYLLVPPGYKGEIPEGYFVYHSKTYGNLVFWRGFIKDGSTQVRRGSDQEVHQNLQPEGRGEPAADEVHQCLRQVFQYHRRQHLQVLRGHQQYRPVRAQRGLQPGDPGPAGRLGIEKGKPFTPDARMKKILTEAAAVGNATARALVFKYPRRRSPTTIRTAPGSPGFIGGSYEFQSQPGVRNHRCPVHFLYYATGITPAMALKLVGKGSQYAIAATDSEGKPLDGSKTYKIHLPPNIPAKDFWSFVVYDNQTRSMLQTDQQYPSIGSEQEGDRGRTPTPRWMSGSARPRPRATRPTGCRPCPARAGTWLLRLYGPEESWFDKTWRPGEIVPVN